MIKVPVYFCRQNKDSKNKSIFFFFFEEKNKSIFILEEQFPRVWSLLGNREKSTNSLANQLYNSAKEINETASSAPHKKSNTNYDLPNVI